MGEAKRRKTVPAPVGADLEQEIVRRVAKRLLTRVAEPLGWCGACYYEAFLLQHVLRERHSLESQVAAGWIFDPVQQAWTSHAWHLFGGRRTDLALHYPLHPHVTPRGHLVVLDEIQRRGDHDYRYALVPPAGEPTIIDRTIDPAERRRREAEHARALALAQGTPEDVRAYLAGAPGGMFEDAMARLVDGG